jgi:predicted metal-dependent phosphoesterase TrpH
LPAGTWHLLLGPYKVGPNGLEWSARIEFDPDPRVPDTHVSPTVTLPDRPDDLPAALPGWYRGDLHAHTVFSDGSAFPAQVAVAARAAGLDFYGITDHNRAQSPVGLVAEDADWPVFVPGVEVTTYAGHFNVWGTDRWYDFRQPDAEGLQRAVDAALADGGFVSINHPKPFGPLWEHPEVTGFAGLEVWNGWWNKLNSVSTRVWDERLRRGERLTPLGGSDMHHLHGTTRDDNPFSPAVLGYPTTWVRPSGPLSAGTILQALRDGDVFVSESPSGPQLEFEVSSTGRVTATVLGAQGNALLLIDQTGVIGAWVIHSEEVVIEFDASPESAYVRLEVHRSTGGIRALSNARFL